MTSAAQKRTLGRKVICAVLRPKHLENLTGPFLRVDSTDRIASRSERDNMSKREDNRGSSAYGII